MVEAGHTGGGFLGDALDGGVNAGIEAGLGRQLVADGVEKGGLLFVGGVIKNGEILLSLGAQHHQTGGIATVVEDHVGRAAIAPLEDAVGEGPVLIQGFALVGEHGNARCRNRSGGVVLGGEDVARGPAHLSAQGRQGFDQDRGLDRHVQRTRNTGALEGLLGAELGAQRHQARHFGFGNRHFLATELSQAEISNHVGRGALQRRRRGGSHHGLSPVRSWGQLAPGWEEGLESAAESPRLRARLNAIY